MISNKTRLNELKNKYTAQKKGKEREYPLYLYNLLYLFILYMVLPVVNVPLMGLSISAPIFFFIALPVFFRPPTPWISKYKKWIALVTAIWNGIFISVIFNGLLSGGVRIDRTGWTSLLQYAYWFLTFIVILYLASSQKGLIEHIAAILAIGIVILALLRLGEAVFGGATGAWTHLRIMTQNNYGIQFSTFFPVLLSFSFFGKKRKLAGFATLGLLVAILINGSRSGWVATIASTFVFLWMYMRTQQHRLRVIGVLFFLIGILGLSATLAPQIAITTFEKRLSSFQKLEEDKSYVIRQLMIQKGLRLYESSPWIGVGVSRWRKEYVPLEIPRILRYESQEYFNRKSSHNSYISYLAENGFVGTVPLAILLIILTFRGYWAASRLATKGQVWTLGVYAGFIGMSIHLWALSGLTGTVTWFIYGLVAAVITIDNQTSTDEKKTLPYASRLSLPRSRYR